MSKGVIIAIVGVVIVLGGGFFLFTRQTTAPSDTTSDSTPATESGTHGGILAGTKSHLLDFTKAEYDKALAGDKLVVLYFYANWCPICREEVPKLYGAFNELTTDQVVGFRVNVNLRGLKALGFAYPFSNVAF